jgi:hypothetical protein
MFSFGDDDDVHFAGEARELSGAGIRNDGDAELRRADTGKELVSRRHLDEPRGFH